MSPKVLWDVVRDAAAHAGIDKLAPHDLRRTCARLCHLAGGELEQIQFLLGHASVQTTERYLGCKQKLGHAVKLPARQRRLGFQELGLPYAADTWSRSSRATTISDWKIAERWQ